MGSIPLIELSFYKNDIISFRPNAIEPFIGNFFNITVPAFDLYSLDSVINLNAKGSEEFRTKCFGSTQRLINYLKQS